MIISLFLHRKWNLHIAGMSLCDDSALSLVYTTSGIIILTHLHSKFCFFNNIKTCYKTSNIFYFSLQTNLEPNIIELTPKWSSFES